jgi:hypothetical protein
MLTDWLIEEHLEHAQGGQQVCLWHARNFCLHVHATLSPSFPLLLPLSLSLSL